MENTITAKLIITHSESGEPLPRLELKIGEITYHFFNGKPVPGWVAGAMTERIESV